MYLFKGDLLRLARNGEFDVIVQGCNCYCRMGSGLAKQIRSEYPEAYTADCTTTPGDRNKLGTYTKATTKDGFTIVNAYTQYRFNRAGESRDVFEYGAFDQILKTLANEFPTSRIGFPMIGMGLACGDPVKIVTAIDQFSQVLERTGGTVTLVDYDAN